MKKENVVGFRVCLQDCKNPNKLYNEIRPANCINELWKGIPLGDQIWMWFEFANREEKELYVEWIKTCDVACETMDLYGTMKLFASAFMYDVPQDMIDNYTN